MVANLLSLLLGAAIMYALLCLVEASRREGERRLSASQNLNELVRQLAVLEAGKVRLSIAQIREVLAVLGLHLRWLPRARARAVLDAIYERAGRSRRTDENQSTI